MKFLHWNYQWKWDNYWQLLVVQPNKYTKQTENKLGTNIKPERKNKTCNVKWLLTIVARGLNGNRHEEDTPQKYISEETDVRVQLICLKGGVRIGIQAWLHQFLHSLNTVGMDVKITKAECWLHRHSKTCYYPLVLPTSVLPSGSAYSVFEVGRRHYSGLSTCRRCWETRPRYPF